MNQFLRRATLFLLIVFLSACGTSTNGGDSGLRNGDIAGNSSGTLQGAPMGSGTSVVTDLRKTIDLTLVNPHSDLELGAAYLTRISNLSEFASLTLPVTNTGTKALCFVWANGLTYRQGALVVATADAALIEGSIGQTASGNYINGCVGAGETGYFIDIQSPDNSNGPLWSIDSLQVESLSASDAIVSGHGGELVPTAYSADGSGALLTVTGRNDGTITLFPGPYSVYFLLDAAGEPLEWSFLDPPAAGSLSPGSTENWSESSFYYDGAASGLRVHFDYEGPTTQSLRTQDAGPLTRAKMLELREDHAKMLAGQQP